MPFEVRVVMWLFSVLVVILMGVQIWLAIRIRRTGEKLPLLLPQFLITIALLLSLVDRILDHSPDALSIAIEVLQGVLIVIAIGLFWKHFKRSKGTSQT